MIQSRVSGISRSKEAIEVQLLIESLRLSHSLDFSRYKFEMVRELIVELKDELGYPSIADMIPTIIHDNHFYKQVNEKLLLHVTEFFREPASWCSFTKHILPQLRTHHYPKIWVAGCASGEEVVSLLILLHEHGLLEKAKVYASDLSESIVDLAKKGQFCASHVKEGGSNYSASGGRYELLNYFDAKGNNCYPEHANETPETPETPETFETPESNISVESQQIIVKPYLANQAYYVTHDLVNDAGFITNHLTICRNVFIYFEKSLQEQVLLSMLDSIVSGGFLWLGQTETTQFSQARSKLRVIDEANSLYQKL